METRRTNTAILSLAFVIALIALSFGQARATQTNIPGPLGSGMFGEKVVVLPNGNFVVVDTGFDQGGLNNIGAVYLYSGATLAVISTLKGGTLDDQVGNGGITVLTNGNFVVSSPNWDNTSPAAADAGAVTWCSKTTGCNGTVSAANSIVGSRTNDNIGSSGVTALTNGNYVVCSEFFDKPAIVDVGAATWGNGATGTVGTVGAANSLVGGAANDWVGSGGATALTNGNYVVVSESWANPLPVATLAGAVTWGNGNGGTVGLVTSLNSLVGDQAGDGIGYNGVTALTNGNYVVSSENFDKPQIANVGAVTWGNGAGGTVGTVGASNSLVGGSAEDSIGGDSFGSDGVTALSNGNYVVSSPLWDNPTGPILNVGAVTWGNGAGGTSGLVTTVNSLVGGSANDSVGGDSTITAGSVTALTNGNYVVNSVVWDNPTGPITNVGAVTWGNGVGGTTGLVTTANSLVGGTSNDYIGNDGVTPLTNGNYVVSSHFWNNPAGPFSDAGAATWGNGAGGTSGLVTSTNSLVGGRATDRVGLGGTTALTNGNYVVNSFQWTDPSPLNGAVGAATWGNGSTGIVGLITTANSLVGSTSSDQVGSSGVTALTNGNYVVNSPLWDCSVTATDCGAATWGNGAGGTVGLVTTSNSFRGALGSKVSLGGTTSLIDGNYAVYSSFYGVGKGAVTLGIGSGGTVGLPTAANTVIGTLTNDISSFSYDAARDRLVVGRKPNNTVTVLDLDAISGTVTYGNALGNPPAPRFVSNVLISGAGSVPVSVFTDGLGATAGQYSLFGFGSGAYTVTPTKTGGINGAISSLDPARIAQHTAGAPFPQLNATQLIVADVSGNGVVTSFDAAMIAKFVAGPPYAAPGIGSTGTWRFTPVNRNYASVGASITGEDYTALLMGEVSGNWTNTGARPENSINTTALSWLIGPMY